MERIGWIGIGVMGSRMLRRVAASGHPTVVFDRNPAVLPELVKDGSVAGTSPADVAARVDVVFTVVSTPEDVRNVYLGPDGLLAGARRGSVLIDMSTSSPDLARTIASSARELGVDTLDAPVSGGPAGAESGALSIMVGGAPEVLDRVRPLLQLLGSTVVHQGPAGSGQGAKIANQIVLAGAMLGICEAFLFTRTSGLDPDRVLDTIRAGIAGSALTTYIWPRVAAGDLAPGFAVEHMVKDLGLALAAGHEAGIAMPGTALVKELYHLVLSAGYQGAGSQALIAALDRGWPQGPMADQR